MLRVSITLLVTFSVLLSSASSQISMFNTGTGSPGSLVTTVGSAITIDNAPVNVAIGSGAIARAAGPSNASYIPTGVALTPAAGFTIQFWFKPAFVTAFGYLFGDGSMVSPLGTGALRCFMNGTLSTGSNVVLRGVPNDANTVGTPGPLVTGVNANGYVHLAVIYDQTLGTIRWLVNGVTNNIVAQTAPFNWTGVNLGFGGTNVTSSAVAAGNYDDIRIYNFARTNADVMADFSLSAAGNGPSGSTNVPFSYFECEGAVTPHTMFIGTNGDATGTGTRIVTSGAPLEWGSDCISQPGNNAAHLFNIHGPTLGSPAINPGTTAYRPAPPPVVNYSTPGLTLLLEGSAFSSPAAAFSGLFPDGLGLLQLLPGLVTLGLSAPYQYQVSANISFALPPGLLQTGDSIDFQGLAFDPAYPLGLAVTNRAVFTYRTPLVGPHAHVEVRGAGAIQVLGFWEIWNTGDTEITQVTLDAATCVANGGTATGFNPAGPLNTGGALTGNSTHRFGTDLICGYTGFVPVGTAPNGITLSYNPPGAGTTFSGTIDQHIFDCESIPANTNGNSYIGTTVSVTFSNGTTLTGLMIADPSDPLAAIIDL